MSWIQFSGRYKKILNSMPKSHHHFFLHRLIKRRNDYTSYCQRVGKYPLLPSARIQKWCWLFQIKYFNNNHVQLRRYIWALIQCGFGVDNNRFGLYIYFSHFWLKGKKRFEPLWLLTLGFVIVVSIWLWDWQLYCTVDRYTTEWRWLKIVPLGPNSNQNSPAHSQD